MTKAGLILLAAIGIASPAHARDAAQVIMPTDKGALAFQTENGYAQAIVAGDSIYLSGVVAGRAPGETDMKPGFDRAFAAIAEILKRAGASWDDVVDITTFHTDLDAQLADFSTVKNRYVKAPFPTWTAIGITRLYEPTALVEIKVVAHKPRR